MYPVKVGIGGAVAVLSLSAGGIAHAGPPEQFYEPGPSKSRTQIEYNGQFGGDGERPHSLEGFVGVSDRLALGLEVEAEATDSDVDADEFGVGAILALTGEEAPLEFALLLQAGVTANGDFPQIEARLIAEHEVGDWEFLGNLILRSEDAEEQGVSLGYALSLHHELGKTVAIGLEASGQAARLDGFEAGFDTAQYLGPSLQFSLDAGPNTEIEVGVKYLHRLDSGDDYRDTLRLMIGLGF